MLFSSDLYSVVLKVIEVLTVFNSGMVVRDSQRLAAVTQNISNVFNNNKYKL